MRPPAYRCAGTLEEACALMAGPGASRVIAGGTDLIPELRRPDAPGWDLLVDIGRLDGLRGIGGEGPRIRIGALSTHAELARSEVLIRRARFLAEAAGMVGSAQIRNRGTLGGNIMNAAACADTLPPLVALDAVAHLRSTAGERAVPIARFFAGSYATTARRDEILTHVEFTLPRAGAGTCFLKLGRRAAVSIARLSVAGLVARDASGRIQDARIVPGAALPVWERMEEAEELLRGRSPSRELFAEAGRAASAAVIRRIGRRWSTEYKEPVLAVLVRRALEVCCTREGTSAGAPS
ncbi:MAG: FAD binding domain-containing protein [Bacteroidota bacterium]